MEESEVWVHVCVCVSVCLRVRVCACVCVHVRVCVGRGVSGKVRQEIEETILSIHRPLTRAGLHQCGGG